MNKITKAQLDNIREYGLNSKIGAIKELRQLTGIGLADAKHVVEYICGVHQDGNGEAEGRRLSSELVLDDVIAVAVDTNTSAPMVLDRELLAINDCMRVLAALDRRECERVLRYLRERYGV